MQTVAQAFVEQWYSFLINFWHVVTKPHSDSQANNLFLNQAEIAKDLFKVGVVAGKIRKFCVMLERKFLDLCYSNTF